MNNPILTHTHKHLLTILCSDGSQADIPIFILPSAPTLEQVQALRVAVERTADPKLYNFCATCFFMIDMPQAAMAMMKRARHYAGLG